MVSGTDEPERILHHRKGTKPYTTTQGEMSNSNTPAGTSNQAGMIKKDRENTEICGSVPSWKKLQSQTAVKLRNLNSFVLKNPVMHDVEDTLDKAEDLRFLNTDTSVKHAFFALLKRH